MRRDPHPPGYPQPPPVAPSNAHPFDTYTVEKRVAGGGMGRAGWAYVDVAEFVGCGEIRIEN